MDDDFEPRRASDWLLLLAEMPDDKVLRGRFDAWMAEDAAREQEWHEAVRTYELMGKTAPAYEATWRLAASRRTAAQPRTHVHPPNRWALRISGPRPARQRRLLQATGAVTAALLIMAIGPDLLLRAQADAVTTTAEVRKLSLADGSVVHLAPQSAVTVAYHLNSRDIRLLKGEAFFNVRSDPARPFRVDANGVRTTVLGTAFDIRRGPDQVDIGVARGHVRVDRESDGRSEHLLPGDHVNVAVGGMTIRRHSSVRQVGSWLNGDMLVTDRPALEVIDRLRPYFGGMIVVRGTRLRNARLTGAYRLTTPEASLQAIARSTGTSLYRITPWILVISGA